MKEGTKVKVVQQLSGHDFEIGEIVERRVGPYEDSETIGFFSETAGIWYMTPEEYEVVGFQKLIHEKSYSSEELSDLCRDIDEVFDENFNPLVADIPRDEYNFHKGSFKVTIIWEE